MYHEPQRIKYPQPEDRFQLSVMVRHLSNLAVSLDSRVHSYVFLCVSMLLFFLQYISLNSFIAQFSMREVSSVDRRAVGS